jgi:hypothetical protein
MNFRMKISKSIAVGVLVGSAFYAGSNLNANMIANTNANTNNNTVICAPPVAANPQSKAEFSVLTEG